MIIEKEGVHEKLKLLALQTLRELAINGYHTILLEMTLINRLLRFLQPSSLGSIVSLESEEAPSCLHRAALEVLEALIAASSYNSQNLISAGMVRILSQSFANFKIKKDSIFDGVFGQLSQANKFKQNEPELQVHESLKGVKYLSYNYLF